MPQETSHERGHYAPYIATSQDTKRRRTDSEGDEGSKRRLHLHNIQDGPPRAVPPSLSFTLHSDTPRRPFATGQSSQYRPADTRSPSSILPSTAQTVSTSTTLTLPSPSALMFATPPSPPHYNPPTTSAVNAAHQAHLSSLQHQVSTSQLALSTLQTEHNALLA